jgi:hypothetical protein
MRGLDPRIHLLRENFLRRSMDCRVKPGNDGVDRQAYNFIHCAFHSLRCARPARGFKCNRQVCEITRHCFRIVIYNEFCNSHVSPAVGPQSPHGDVVAQPHAAAAGVR